MSAPVKTAADVLGEYLRPYQRAWIGDQSRKKIALKSRQIGYSECIVVEGLIEAASVPGRDVYFISVNVDGGKDLLRRVSRWIERFNAAGFPVEVAESSVMRIELANGSRLSVLPNRPASVRGKTGTLYLDELAFWPQDFELWTAILPAISSNTDLKVRVVSTPWGEDNLYAKLWSEADGWSRHRVDVYEAVEQGFPVDVDELRKDYTDDQWAQEFECSFTAGSGAYYSPALIRRALSLGGRMGAQTGRLIVGVDVASVHDLAAIVWVRECDGGVDVERVEAYRNMTSPELEVRIDEVIARDEPDLVVIDATGEGSGLAQYARASHGALIWAQKITRPWKESTCIGIKRAMEGDRLGLCDDADLRRDLTSVEKKISAANNVIFESPRGGRGHGDRFWAAALALSKTRQVGEWDASPTVAPIEMPDLSAALGLPSFGGGAW